jgi:hypothetical protein
VSFDIIILRPKAGAALLQSIEEVQEVAPLGTAEEVRKKLNLVAPKIMWSSDTSGLLEAAEGYAVEISIPDEDLPSSLHLSLHFGSEWESEGRSAFDVFVRNLYEMHQWQAFAVSDNSALLIDGPEA